MSVITLDDETIQKLRECSRSVQIGDAQGNIVGTFQPGSVRIYRQGEVPELDPEELHRRLHSSERLTTEEVRRRLRSRP